LRDPVGSIAASIAESLSGLLPLHTSHSSRGTIDNDWKWSVGHSPLSITAPGHTFSLIQRDTVHRSYIIHAIRAASLIVNDGTQRLQSVMTSLDNESLTRLQSSSPNSNTNTNGGNGDSSYNNTVIRAIQIAYNDVHTTLSTMIHYTAALQYDDACQLTSQVISNAQRFATSVDTLMMAATQLQCSNNNNNNKGSSSKAVASQLLSGHDRITLLSSNGWSALLLDTNVYLFAAIICVLLILRRVLRPVAYKAHVN
jgi:hypothetical protein